MNGIIRVFDSKEQLMKALTRHLNQSVQQKSGLFNLAISGGSTPLKWFDFMAAGVGVETDWKQVRFYWVDERCVPPDHPGSNYGNALKRLLNPLKIDIAQVYRIMGELDAEEARTRYESVLNSELPKIDGTPHFDLIILGMGTDGHTASVFPGQEKIWESGLPCEVSQHPETGQRRISLTGRVINKADEVIFIVTGTDKANVLAEMSAGGAAGDRLPASWVQPVSRSLYWYMDRDAAAGVRSKLQSR